MICTPISASGERRAHAATAGNHAHGTMVAQDVTTLVHGAEATTRVEQASRALFGRGELTGLDERTLGDAVRELPGVTVPMGEHSVVDLFVQTGLVASKSAARRAISDGGAYVNNVKVEADDALLGAGDLLHSRWGLLRRGRKSLAVVAVEGGKS